jgi:hypothetical protein
MSVHFNIQVFKQDGSGQTAQTGSAVVTDNNNNVLYSASVGASVSFVLTTLPPWVVITFTYGTFVFETPRLAPVMLPSSNNFFALVVPGMVS